MESKQEVATEDWHDITGEFFDCLKDLELGELTRGLGLFEAMTALEMMDPKMDAGMRCNKNKTPPLTFETAVASGELKLTDLSYPEIIGITDSLLACFVSWLEGHSLAQTVYTCLYMHNVSAIGDAPLKAFCFGMNNTMKLVKETILAAAVYEEEDFQPIIFPHPLAEVSHDAVYAMLKLAEEDLIRATKSASDEDQAELRQAVINRLKFMRFFLDTLHALYEAKVDIDLKIVKQLNILSELLAAMRKSQEKGTPKEADSDSPNPLGFSMLVNQRMLGPTFPRCTTIKSRPASVTHLEELVQRLKWACKVTTCTNYHSALNFFMDFSRRAGSCLLSRSVLQKFYLHGTLIMGHIPLKDFLRDSARHFIAPPALLPGHPVAQSEAAQQFVDIFLERALPTMYAFLKVCGFNRARQRDKLVRLLMDDFVQLQDEAERMDAHLHTLAGKAIVSAAATGTTATTTPPLPRQYLACFGTWVLYNSLRAMCSFLLSGLELELYSVHEYLYIFWYLYEFLFGWVVSALTRADSFLAVDAVERERGKGGKEGKDGKEKEGKKRRQRGGGKPYGNEVVLNQALQNMCGGYYKGLAGFLKDERIPQPLAVFDNEVIRFNYRFAPFAGFTTPPAVPYCEFREMRATLLRGNRATELYAAAAKHFQMARSYLEQLANPDAEMNDILRVAKVNCIVFNLLANGHKRESRATPEFDFGTHRFFPIVKQQ